MTLFFFKPPNIFIPHKFINIYKNITASIFTKCRRIFFLIIYRNITGYEKLVLEKLNLLSKNNKITIKEQ